MRQQGALIVVRVLLGVLTVVALAASRLGAQDASAFASTIAAAVDPQFGWPRRPVT